MARRKFVGSAPNFPCIRTVKLSGLISETSDLTFKIGNKSVTFENTGGADTADSFLQKIDDAWDALTYPEFDEIDVTYVPSGDSQTNPYLLMTGPDGIPWDLTVSSPHPTVDIDTITQGGPGVNEKQSFYITPTPTGGTYRIIVNLGNGPEYSIPLSFDATADEIAAALAAGTALGPGDLRVTGVGTLADPFVVEYGGLYANTNIAQLSIDGANLIGNGVVTVGTTRQGAVGSSDAIQTLYVRKGVGYNFKVNGFGTGTLTDPAPAVLQAALEALPTVGTGNIKVYGGYSTSGTINFGDQYPLLFRFTGALGQSYQNQITTSNGETLVANTGYNPGGGASNGEIWEYKTDATGGTFTITIGANTTSALARNITASALQTALAGLASVGSGNVYVQAGRSDQAGPSYQTWLIMFLGSKFGVNVTDMTVNAGSLSGQTFSTLTKVIDGGSTAGVNEIQSVSTNGAGGTFTLTFAGQTTAAISAFATPAQIVSALEALSNIGVGDVAVTGSGSANDPWLITFQTALAATDVAQMTGNGALLTGGFSAGIDTPQAGSGPTGTVWSIVINGATGGTFLIGFRGELSSTIAYNVTNSNLDTALEAISTIGSGNITVTGSGTTGTPFQVTAGGTLAGLTLPTLIAYNDALTGTGAPTSTVATLQNASGQWFWSDPLNWVNVADGSTGIPATGDDVDLENVDASRPILYGLAQSAVKLNTLRVKRDFQAQIGLPEYNPLGYQEYRPTYLQIGMQGTKLLEIGAGAVGSGGSGSGRLRIDTGSDQTVVIVYFTAGATDGEIGAFSWKGTHSGNTFEQFSGFSAIAVRSGETANLASLKEYDGSVTCGIGVAIGSGGIIKTGGSIYYDTITCSGPISIRG